ncbi:MAG: 23S rRNA (guanosine(2251)-2'-O)-methyltransferase RlmB [Candidatus Competibacteraceae bacterium]|jgi:23S rRNA (guanosine2251-2'-O)-methyltransferase|nr:23S rRNA (guanosine(2251)-2'-O)-methyltransferase RlmB [Candidatus Competibacteraceae bacterium]
MADQEQWLSGLHAVTAALRNHPERLESIRVERRRRDARIRGLLEEAERCGVSVRFTDRDELDRLSQQTRHQGVVARYAGSTATVRDESDLPALLDAVQGPPLLLVLDSVQDPHNLGACLRSADAAGVHAVLAPADRAAGLTATVRKVASGAAESVPFIQVTNLARAMRQLQEQGLWFIGAASEAEQSLYAVDFTGPVALVMGAEEKGLRRLTRETCDVLAHIPMAGNVESLNVSVAAGVFLFEAVRQRTAAGSG